MLRIFQKGMLAVALAFAGTSAHAFSLLGPFDTAYQVQRIGYNLTFHADVGGPMNLGEAYRWNIRTITYAIDPDFLRYFGQRGADEIRKAFDVLNAIPPFSKMSEDLNEFPLNTRRMNYEASALFLLDVKSEMLGIMMEEMGLASPERYVWTLQERLEQNPLIFYWVIKRNFDPVTIRPSSFVNGTLYTYGIFEFPSPPSPFAWADAVEFQVDPLAQSYSAVASIIDGLHGGQLALGEYVTGLTRDDIGGLRYIYRPNNYVVEPPLAGTTVAGGAPGSPYDPTTATNAPITALRPGVDKLTFVEGKFESTLGNFISITNRYVDYYVTNNTLVKQYTQRAIVGTPDILITVADLGRNFAIVRGSASSWTNNNVLQGANTSFVLAGPGTITPTILIAFNKAGESYQNDNSSPAFLFEPGALRGFNWAAFDGTTNRPFIFPSGDTIEDLERRVLGR